MRQASALATVVRSDIPVGFDQYEGFDLVVYANLASIPLATPQDLASRKAVPDPSFLTDLQYVGLFQTLDQNFILLSIRFTALLRSGLPVGSSRPGHTPACHKTWVLSRLVESLSRWCLNVDPVRRKLSSTLQIGGNCF